MVPLIKWSFEVEIKTEKQADSIVDALDEQERKKLLDALNKKMWTKEEKKEIKETENKKEAKEKIEWLPELADKNFRVENTKGWKEVTDPYGVKVKENPEWDVREYLEGKCKGEQLFTDISAKRETYKAGKTLPASWKVYEDIIDKKYHGDYKSFLEWENMIFAGWRFPGDKRFNYVDRGFDLRCADGSTFYGDRNGGNNDGWNEGYGFSVRCLKD